MAETTNGFAAAQRLRTLLRNIGPGLTYEAARRHLGEDGQAVTRAEYDAAWRSLHGGERGGSLGRERLPPGSPPPAPKTEQQPRPEPEVKPVSEQNGAAPPQGRLMAARQNMGRLVAVVRQLGPEATYGQIRDKARPAGILCSDPLISKAKKEAYGPGKPPAPRPPAPRPTPAPAPAPAPVAPAPQPQPAAEGDLLASVLDARRRLAALKAQVEAAGGTMSYKLAITVEEEG